MTDMLPLVSIITAAYNRASYLDETIRSVLTQDHSKIESIVLDDGSTDNTREVLAKYTGRIIWETHANMGETRTVNKGLSMARGEIVTVVKSDDPLLPGAVSTAVALMDARPDILVAYPDWNYIGPDSEVISHVQTREYDYLYMLKRHYCTPGPGAFIRREAVELAGMRDVEFRCRGDFEFWLRLGLYGEFARIPETLATWREHPGAASVSARGVAMAAEHIRLIQKLYARSDLPVEVRGVRREAFGTAHWTACVKVGRTARNVALRYLVKALLYSPRNYMLNSTSFVLGLVLIAPDPLYPPAASVWRMSRRVVAKLRRSATDSMAMIGYRSR